MQYLRAGNWVLVSKPNPVGERVFDRILQNGWIERRGTGPRLEIKITPAGLAALQALQNFRTAGQEAIRRLVELGLKAKK